MRISRQEYDALITELEQLRYEFSVIREVLSRLVMQKGSLTFDVVDEIPEGYVKWEMVQTTAGSREMTVWFEPEKEPVAAMNGKGENA